MMVAMGEHVSGGTASGAGGGSRTVERGIVARHRRGCPVLAGAACLCCPSFQAMVWSARDAKPVRKSFGSLREARAWRARARVELSLGRLDAPSKLKLAEAAERWLSEARAGVVRTRSGDRLRAFPAPLIRFAVRRRWRSASSGNGPPAPQPPDRTQVASALSAGRGRSHSVSSPTTRSA
jgi:hypothetical protein